jgi:hypothetical protein
VEEKTLNFLRRVYLLLLGLLLVIMVTLLLLSPQAVGSWVGSISELSPVVRIAITVVVDLFLLALMYLQVRPDPGSKVNGLLMRGSGAVTEVSVESARERILKAVNDVPDVISAEATVKPVRGKAEIEMQVVVMGDDVRLPNKQKDINRALRQVIDKQLGLQIAGQPRIHIRIHGEEPLKPVITTPVVPTIEKELAVVLPTKIEPEPEPKPLSGLFGGYRQPAEEKVKEEVERKAFVDKPLPPVAPEPDIPVKPHTGLFGGWRDHDSEREEPESVVPSVSEAPAAVMPISVVSKPGENALSSQVGSGIDGDKTLKLDLDDELSHSDVDDFIDDELDKSEDSVVGESDEESNSKKPDETTL